MEGRYKLKHYSTTEWVDFARGLGTQADRKDMHDHLESGCTECGRTAGLFAKVAAKAAREAEYDIPEYVLHYAHLIYRLQQPEEVRMLPHTIATLIFDSFRGPLPAGVRSQRQMVRQVLYQAGSYFLDFRLEHERNSIEMTLMGQITNSEHPDKGIADLQVLLLSEERVIAKALSNQFGEFRLKYQAAQSLRLYAPVSEGNEGIEVPLGGILSEEAAAT
jgi:hypothetical protein